MGALTISRKRGDDFNKSLASLSPSIDQSHGHISKKPKLSVSAIDNKPVHDQPALVNSVVSRIFRYPEAKSRFSREVHAPVRNSRFGSFHSAMKIQVSASSKEKSAAGMDKFKGISRIYQDMKDAAFGTLRYFKKGDVASVSKQKWKQVIEVDSEEEIRDGVSDDSSVEEVKIVEMMDNRWMRGQRADDGLEKLNVETVKKQARLLDSSGVTDIRNANAKVVVFDQGSEDSKVPLYRRLYDGTKKRDDKLSNLKFNIELNEKRIPLFRLLWPRKKEEQIKKDLSQECFTPLTKEEENQISSALSNSYRRRVLVTHENSNIDITAEVLQCLRPGAWLNDEVINLYLELLKEREKRDPQKFLKCHFFNTFFYKKLISGRGGYNFQSVRRWTTQRKLGYALKECDKIFVPIHKEIHWCLAIINQKDKKIQYLDSLRGVDTHVLNVLSRYFVDEVKDKCGEDIDVSSWEQEFVVDLPEQENGFDCGMFMIKYADFYSRDIGLCFGQEHMPYFRQRTAKEILKLRAE